ncbi:MAG: PilW family protein [Nitrospiraceae bacterium]
MTTRLIKNDFGMCLTELMIAMATGMIVLSASIQMLDHFQQRLWAQHRTIGLHQDQRIGMRIFEEELRMAGSYSTEPHASFRRVGRQEIEFDANIGGSITALTQAVLPGGTELSVADGSAWPKGKRILIRSGDHCAEGHLAQDGQRTLLKVVNPISEVFPPGSEITITNRVRYYLSKARSGKMSLMRQVDGGSNSIVSDVTLFELNYVDKTGKPTVDPAAVVRVRVQLAVGADRRPITSEVGLRTR